MIPIVAESNLNFLSDVCSFPARLQKEFANFIKKRKIARLCTIGTMYLLMSILELGYCNTISNALHNCLLFTQTKC